VEFQRWFKKGRVAVACLQAEAALHFIVDIAAPFLADHNIAGHTPLPQFLFRQDAGAQFPDIGADIFFQLHHHAPVGPVLSLFGELVQHFQFDGFNLLTAVG